MKKIITAILTATLTTTSVFAKPEHEFEEYLAICSVKSTFGEKCEMLNRTFKIHRNVGSSFLEHFQPQDSNDRFILHVFYSEASDKFVVDMQDETEQVNASVSDHDPRRLNLFFGTKDAGLDVTCGFTPIKTR